MPSRTFTPFASFVPYREGKARSTLPAVSVRAELSEERRAIERLRWYVLLRWTGVAVLYSAAMLARAVGGFHFSLVATNVLAPVVLGYNIIVWRLVRDWMASPPTRWRLWYRLAGNAQCTADLLVLAVGLHFAGGIESPALADPIAVLVVASLVLPELDSLAQGILACALTDGVVLAEYAGWLDHVSLGVLQPGIESDARYIASALLTYDVLVLFVVALVIYIAHRLRDRESEVIRLYGQEQATVARLEELDRMKSDFLASVSHELRTPLTAIEGFGAYLDANWDQVRESDREEAMRTITRQARRLHALVVNLLDFSAIDAGKLTFHVETLQVLPLARAAASAFPAADPLIDVDSDLWVVADPVRAEQIVVNLLDNATKYGVPPIVVNAERHDGHIVLSVTDRGPGIPAAHRDELFARFARVGTEQFAGGGVGLGLALVRGYAEGQGGRAWYEEGPDGGARFCVSLPAAPTEAKAVEPPGPAVAAGS